MELAHCLLGRTGKRVICKRVLGIPTVYMLHEQQHIYASSQSDICIKTTASAYKI